MSRHTSRVSFLAVEEFESRAVPALLGLSLPTAALSGLHGLLTAVENGAAGLLGRVIPSDPGPPSPPGGGVIPGLPTNPTPNPPPTNPDPPAPPAGSDGPVAGPDIFTPPPPVTEAPVAPPADTPTATATPAASEAGEPTALGSFSPEAAAPAVALQPAPVVGFFVGVQADAAPGRAAGAATTGVFVPDAPPAALAVAAPGPVLMGIPVDAEAVAVTLPEVVPPGIEVGPTATFEAVPAGAVAPAAEAVAPDAVPAAEPESFNLASWGWSAAVAVFAAGGYWLLRRHRLARKVADVLFPAKLAVQPV